MKIKKNVKKLVLNKETISKLDQEKLKGGYASYTRLTYCNQAVCPSATCKGESVCICIW